MKFILTLLITIVTNYYEKLVFGLPFYHLFMFFLIVKKKPYINTGNNVVDGMLSICNLAMTFVPVLAEFGLTVSQIAIWVLMILVFGLPLISAACFLIYDSKKTKPFLMSIHLVLRNLVRMGSMTVNRV